MKNLVIFMSKQKITPRRKLPLPPLAMFSKDILLTLMNFIFLQIKKQKMLLNYYPSLRK